MSNPIVMADNDIQQITASIDGAYNRLALGQKDYIIKGVGDEFAITKSLSSLNVTVGTGEAIICGRTFTITEALQTTMPANSTKNLCLRIDLSQPAGSEGSLSLVNTGAETQEDLNDTGVIYELPICRLTSNATGITSSLFDGNLIYAGISLEFAGGNFYATDGASGTRKKLGEVVGSATPQDVKSGVTFMSAGSDAVQTGAMPVRAASTINTSNTDRTIAAGQYLTGAQTIKAVTTSNLTAGNIKHGVNVKVGDSNSAGRIASVTGTHYNDGTTYTLNNTGTVDMGANSSHRYIQTSGLYKPSGTVTLTANNQEFDCKAYAKARPHIILDSQIKRGSVGAGAASLELTFDLGATGQEAVLSFGILVHGYNDDVKFYGRFNSSDAWSELDASVTTAASQMSAVCESDGTYRYYRVVYSKSGGAGAGGFASVAYTQ